MLKKWCSFIVAGLQDEQTNTANCKHILLI